MKILVSASKSEVAVSHRFTTWSEKNIKLDVCTFHVCHSEWVFTRMNPPPRPIVLGVQFSNPVWYDNQYNNVERKINVYHPNPESYETTSIFIFYWNLNLHQNQNMHRIAYNDIQHIKDMSTRHGKPICINRNTSTNWR